MPSPYWILPLTILLSLVPVYLLYQNLTGKAMDKPFVESFNSDLPGRLPGCSPVHDLGRNAADHRELATRI